VESNLIKERKGETDAQPGSEQPSKKRRRKARSEPSPLPVRSTLRPYEVEGFGQDDQSTSDNTPVVELDAADRR